VIYLPKLWYVSTIDENHVQILPRIILRFKLRHEFITTLCEGNRSLSNASSSASLPVKPRFETTNVLHSQFMLTLPTR
jgi:hypothetical protein